MLWHVEDTNLYLMGSIHVLERTRNGLFPEAEQIYQKSLRVTFEHDFSILPDPALTNNIAGRPLSTQIPATVFACVAREWVNLGLDSARLEQFQPWLAAMIIVLKGAARRGIDEAHGVDKILWARAEQDGKTRTTLEKTDAPLKILSQLSAQGAIAFLLHVTNPPTNCQNELDIMIKAWHDHDDAAMENILRVLLKDR